MEDAGKPDSKNENIKIGLTFFVLFLLVGIYFGWLGKNKENFSIKSFEECVAAGNPVRESYPEVCALKSGKTFTNPGQKLFLNINEWGVRLDLFGKDGTATYSIDKNNSDNAIISSKLLDDFAAQNNGCASANKQVVLARSKKEVPNSKNLGAYYYYMIPTKITPCLGSDIAKIQKLNKQAYELQLNLPSYKTVELNQQ